VDELVALVFSLGDQHRAFADQGVAVDGVGLWLLVADARRPTPGAR